MRQQYDFKNAVRNPHAKRMKTPISLRLDVNTINYFKQLSAQAHLPYQTLINAYLADCAQRQLKPQISWNT